MTKYRIFLVSITTISWVFLCGLNMAVDNDKLILENQKTQVEPDYYETEHARQLMEAKQLKAKSTIKLVTASPQTPGQKPGKAAEADVADDKPIKRDELEKPLDLSVPVKAFENADRIMEQRSAAQSRETTIFAPETRKKARPIELDGNFLMSPEPEAEKRKSFDGAGIVINIKR